MQKPALAVRTSITTAFAISDASKRVQHGNEKPEINKAEILEASQGIRTASDVTTEIRRPCASLATGAGDEGERGIPIATLRFAGSSIKVGAGISGVTP
jgi:hypothetical protein